MTAAAPITLTLNLPTQMQQGNYSETELLKQELEPLMVYKENLAGFANVMSKFLKMGRNPNLTFSEISVGDITYRNPTCFHVIYLFWKQPDGEEWSVDANKWFEYIIDQMLNDGRLDLHATFTEHFLSDTEHFFDHKQSSLSREEGYSLELMNIAHYATVIGDLSMLEKVLQRNPELIEIPCCIVKGKALIDGDYFAVTDLTKKVFEQVITPSDESFYMGSSAYVDKLKELDDKVAGELAHGAMNIKIDGFISPIIRTVKVTLLHLAAKAGDDLVCGYLLATGANTLAQASDFCTPSAYLQQSISEKFIKASQSTARLFKAIQPIARIKKFYLPQTQIILKKNGYDLVYDTSKKISILAYERITKNSLQGNASRDKYSFKVDQDIPKVNQSKDNDYTNSGYDRGHMVPAADAVISERAMEDTFLMSNISPQNPRFNRNYWKGFEVIIRTEIQKYDLLEVVTGALFLPKQEQDGKMRVSHEVIGKSNVAVPTHFYKVIYFNGTSRSCAYVLPNQEIPSGTPLDSFLVTLKKIQELSGTVFDRWRS